MCRLGGGTLRLRGWGLGWIERIGLGEEGVCSRLKRSSGIEGELVKEGTI